MKILIVHQNFPAQFLHLAPALAARGHEVRVLTLRKELPGDWHGVRIHRYPVQRSSTPGIHPWLTDLETKVVRGEAAFRVALTLQAEGFVPDLILAHPGWGESLFLKEVWPAAKLAIYAEFFYTSEGGDTGFDPEFPVADVAADRCRLRLKNLNNQLALEQADAALSPTHWQASTYPAAFRDRISVIHDGIDCDALRPDPGVRFELPTGQVLTRDDEVITFVNRNLEPYRGYHRFMRALPALLRERPRAQVLIVGGDDVSYGARPPQGTTWKQTYLDEVRADIDGERVHFLGMLSRDRFTALLQLSTVHVYLTYPFVLSWSLLEAMSIGCAIVASDTAPVREVITPDETGRLVDFFDTQALVRAVAGLLDDAPARVRLGQAARHAACTNYDLRSICLPRQLAWVEAFRSR